MEWLLKIVNASLRRDDTRQWHLEQSASAMQEKHTCLETHVAGYSGCGDPPRSGSRNHEHPRTARTTSFSARTARMTNFSAGTARMISFSAGTAEPRSVVTISFSAGTARMTSFSAGTTEPRWVVETSSSGSEFYRRSFWTINISNAILRAAAVWADWCG